MINKLSGKVFSGKREGADYIKIYASKINELIGFTPYIGTLNLKAEKNKIKSFLADITSYTIPEFTQDDHNYGAVTLYPVTIGTVKGAIVRPERTTYDQSIIELIAPVNLRDTLHIEDGSSVEVMHEN